MRFAKTVFPLIFSLLLILAASPLFAQSTSAPSFANRPDVKAFIHMMVTQYGFNQADLTQVFNEVEEQPSIVVGMSTTKEQLPWYKYRDIFITPERINQGVDFWKNHQKTLQAVNQRDGVDPAIIVAIIGVETYYGKHQGTYRVIDSLSTLAFDYPSRGPFFKEELKEYLLLTRENNINPMLLKGSYAGAMGQPQFMPSSYRHYAVAFNDMNNKQKDLANNADDVIASVSNYFKKNGWTTGEAVAFPAKINGSAYKLITANQLKPAMSSKQLAAYGISPQNNVTPPNPLTFIMLALPNDQAEYWLGCHNFYVISRYNPRLNYAMAVYQLSEAMKKQMAAS